MIANSKQVAPNKPFFMYDSVEDKAAKMRLYLARQ
jgi:hypothetical protein